MTVPTPEQRADAPTRLPAPPWLAELVRPPWQYGLFDHIVVDPPINGGQYQYGPAHVRWSERVTIPGWAK